MKISGFFYTYFSLFFFFLLWCQVALCKVTKILRSDGKVSGSEQKLEISIKFPKVEKKKKKIFGLFNQ